MLINHSDIGESYDSVINRLLDEVEDDLKNRTEVTGYFNVGVSDDTLNRLKSLKTSNNDSYTKLLTDAFSYLD